MLALRYLNPLRTYFSVITLICLVGVAMGIMVLMVTLSVMEGLQRDIKSRFLAFSPHVTVYYTKMGRLAPMENWREVVEALSSAPGVQMAYPKIEDYVLVDASGAQKPCSFRAIDTENRDQVNDLKTLIQSGSYDMGMGEEAIISQNMAQSMGIAVGDKVRVYAKRNYEDVIKTYNKSEYALKKQEGQMLAELGKVWDHASVKNNLEWVDTKVVNAVADTLGGWTMRETTRESENKVLAQLLALLENPEKEEEGKSAYSLETGESYKALLEEIRNLDTDAEDLQGFKDIKQIIMPRDLEVIGIYLASRHVASPDMIVPLNVAQELLDYSDPETGFMDAAQGVAVRAVDPYNLPPVEEAVRAVLERDFVPEDPQGRYLVQNWAETPVMANWVDLMSQERMMLSFVLFFIMLVSSFCIMAVMFAMSIQRKKEIAVMRALGAIPRQVIYVFLWQGVIIGLLGCILGVAWGRLVLHYRLEILEFLRSINLNVFPEAVHGVSQIPYHIELRDIAMITIVSFIMVVIASIIPAILTSRQDPAKSLRSL